MQTKKKKIENIGNHNFMEKDPSISISNEKEEHIVYLKGVKLFKKLIKMTILPFLNALTGMEKDSFS